MFADTAKIHLKAGKGGDGAVSFRHEIYIPKGGPDGGNGGKGGDIVFVADKDTDTLVDFRFNPILTAKNGKNGAGQRAAGRSGEDLIVKVPVGTSVYRNRKIRESVDSGPASPPPAAAGGGALNLALRAADDPLSTDSLSVDSPSVESSFADSSSADSMITRVLLADLTHDGERVVIAHGGAGGFGNAHFKSSVRQTPRIAEVGEPGEEFDAELELKLVADVGLVGLPNAGKSTFLSVVTSATPKIANYPFTTLVPSLGVATVNERNLLIADIPGLIEGAAEGKGLGHDFLRHVSRTSVLLHLIDIYNDDVAKAYRTIRKELENYEFLDEGERKLSDKPEIVALTKCEGMDSELIDMQKAEILEVNPGTSIFAISARAHHGLDELLEALYETVLAEKRRKKSVDEVKNPEIPTISLSPDELSEAWNVEKVEGKFMVKGEKIEKFARRTDFSNYASVNRLRDIMKKLGIRAELTNQGAVQDSVIEIAGHEFTLVEE